MSFIETFSCASLQDNCILFSVTKPYCELQCLIVETFKVFIHLSYRNIKIKPFYKSRIFFFNFSYGWSNNFKHTIKVSNKLTYH